VAASDLPALRQQEGVSSHQLHRTLGVTLKTAWFMGHRIREAMRDGSLAPLGGEGMTVEADETFIGRKKNVPAPQGGYSHKHAVLALVERGGRVRSVHVAELTKAHIGAVLRANVARESRLMTDEARPTGAWAPTSPGTGRSTTPAANT
jgi:hypothetical protein